MSISTAKSMFDRTIDFRMEKTENSYVACRALSIRARDINAQNKQYTIDTEAIPPNPTAVALTDYSLDRIAVIDNIEIEEES
jgi:DNA-directed RNA polymerase subunit K/omega